MPYINTKTTVTVSKEQRDNLKSRFGEVISDIGKTESWLMVGFEDNMPMYFKGSDEKPLALLEVSLYGKASAHAYDMLTGDLTNIISEELGIQPDCIYIKYHETDYWGWNGNNF